MDWLSILSWNVHGLASTVNRNNVKRFVQSHNPGVVCLQESMCNIQNDNMKLSMGVFEISCFVEVPSTSLLGGLVIFWNPAKIKMEHVEKSIY